MIVPAVSTDDSSMVAQLAMSELSIGGSPAAGADPITIEQRNLNADHEWKKLFGTSKVSATPLSYELDEKPSASFSSLYLFKARAQLVNFVFVATGGRGS